LKSCDGVFTISPKELNIPVGEYKYFIMYSLPGSYSPNFIEADVLQVTE
jgi:hypothetical protein